MIIVPSNVTAVSAAPGPLALKGVTAASSSTLTLPAHEKNDLIILWAGTNNSSGSPVFAEGGVGNGTVWYLALGSGYTAVFWTIATSNNHTIPAWAQGTPNKMVAAVYSGAYDDPWLGGHVFGYNNGTTSVFAPAITLQKNNGTSAVLHFASGGVEAGAGIFTTAFSVAGYTARAGGAANSANYRFVTKDVTTSSSQVAMGTAASDWNGSTSFEIMQSASLVRKVHHRTTSVSSWSEVSIPSHVAGDLIVISATGDTALPTTPAGWTTIASGSKATLAYRIATSSSSTATSTWANAVFISASVFRGHNPANPIGGAAITNGGQNNFTAPAVTMSKTDGSSQLFYVLAFDSFYFEAYGAELQSGYTDVLKDFQGRVAYKNNTTSDGAVNLFPNGLPYGGPVTTLASMAFEIVAE